MNVVVNTATKHFKHQHFNSLKHVRKKTDEKAQYNWVYLCKKGCFYIMKKNEKKTVNTVGRPIAVRPPHSSCLKYKIHFQKMHI